MIIKIKIQNTSPIQKEIDRVNNLIHEKLDTDPRTLIIIQNKEIINTLLNYYDFNLQNNYKLLNEYIKGGKENDLWLKTNEIILIRSDININTNLKRSDIQYIDEFIYFTKFDKLPKKTFNIYGMKITPKRYVISDEFKVITYYDSDTSYSNKSIVILHDGSSIPIDVAYRIFTKGDVYFININNLNKVSNFNKLNIFSDDFKTNNISSRWMLAMNNNNIPSGAINNKIIHNISNVEMIPFTLDDPVFSKINGTPIMIVGNKIYFLEKDLRSRYDRF